jgi:hypothetical protein
MLLRSLTKHIKDQNWFAVVLDFVIVVVGILIAFQITNWNENRQNDTQAERILDRLEQEFTLKIQQTESGVLFHEKRLKESSRLIKGIQLGEFDEQYLLEDAKNVVDFFTPPGPSTAFQELISSGKTDLIRNETLRNTLYQLNSYVSFLRDSYMHFTAPLVQTRKALLQTKLLVSSGEPSKSFKEVGRIQSIDSSKLLDNPEILDSLQLTYQTHDNIHIVLLRIHQNLEAILTLIKAEKEKTQ